MLYDFLIFSHRKTGQSHHKRPNHNEFSFITIDASENDLPWQFTALSVPTVLFFPAVRNSTRSVGTTNKWTLDRSETRAFPANKPFTTVNLLNFILVNLPLSSRTQVALDLCDKKCLENSKDAIVKELTRKEIDLKLETNDASFLNDKVQQKIQMLNQLKTSLHNQGVNEHNEKIIKHQNVPTVPSVLNAIYGKDEL